MLKGFRDFLLRGNIVELAIAVVIGTAFTAVVSAFTKSVIQPLIAAIGGNNINGLAVQLNKNNPASTVDFAAVINAIITFLITAAVVYFIFVVPMNTIAERRKARKGEPDPEEEVGLTDIDVLIEIRDLLRAQQAASTAQSAGYQPPDTPPTTV